MSLYGLYRMDEKAASPSDLQWVERRERVVQQAIDDGDLGKLRELAALPGGFGSNEMRKKVWPILLGTERYFASMSVGEGEDSEKEKVELPSHPEEEQVGKDTNRSFVSYPREAKMEMKADLHDLIIGVLRQYPSISYFQGYHDIMSVLCLTYIPLPSAKMRTARPSRRDLRQVKDELSSNSDALQHGESQDNTADEKASDVSGEGGDRRTDSRNTDDWSALRQCAQVVSLCRVRDAMGAGMQPMMAYLRLLKRILQVADPEIAQFSSTISPVPTLPFFALSWILTLFSHDVDTLEPIQRMFDYLLSRNPISAIYLAVAILVAKKPQMLKLVREMGQEAMDDPSILHPLFARLPPLVADNPDRQTLGSMELGEKAIVGENEMDEPNPYEPIALSTIFRIADDLLARYPWDGPVIKGQEILGHASSVMTYPRELESDWTLKLAETLVNGQVIKPGADMLDEEEEEDPLPIRKLRHRRLRVRIPRNKAGTLLAVSVVLFGVGIAVYGARSGGPRSNWARWWTVVVRDWVSRTHPYLGSVHDRLRSWAGFGVGFLRKLIE